MDARILFGTAFALSLALLIYQLLTARARQRNGEATPSYEAGNIPGSLGVLVLCGSNLVELTESARLVAICIALPFIAAETFLYVRARRREWRR